MSGRSRGLGGAFLSAVSASEGAGGGVNSPWHQDSVLGKQQPVGDYVADMTDSIFIAYTDASWDHEVSQKELTPEEIGQRTAHELLSLVSYVVPCVSSQEAQNVVRYQKIVIIKEEDPENLSSRLSELLSGEDCKLVNFGIFSRMIARSEILERFSRAAKTVLRASCFANVLGTIWSAEVNGSGTGCGLIAADDKIHVWRDL